MAKSQIPVVATDFDRVWSYLEDRGITPAKTIQQSVGIAKRIHRATYSLILWRFRLRNLPSHGGVFIEEIASDALQILPQSLMGYSKTTKLLIRGIIENTLRHIYFSDHPIEFARMNQQKKWYVPTDELFSYPLWHETFEKTEREHDAVNKLKILYSDLSAGIHGRQVQDLEMRAALGKIKYVEADFEDHAQNTEKCAQFVNFILAVFHVDKVRLFQQEDRQIILRTMPMKSRRIFNNLP